MLPASCMQKGGGKLDAGTDLTGPVVSRLSWGIFKVC